MRESKAKAFMYTCIGILAICVAVQVTVPATAQGPVRSEIASAYFCSVQGYHMAVTTTGDVYYASGQPNGQWHFARNIFEDVGPISNKNSTLGNVKRAFR